MTKFGALTRIKFLLYAFNGRFVAQITASALVGKQWSVLYVLDYLSRDLRFSLLRPFAIG